MEFKYKILSSVVLKNFLQQNQYSKKMISAIKRDGALIVNEVPVTVRKILEIGDILVVKLPDEQASENLLPDFQPLDVLFEDQYFIAVSKGKKQNCAPSREHPHGSLIEQVMGYLKAQTADTNVQPIPHIVTRLDRDTSGIVLFAKHGHLHHRIASTEMKKIYHCICKGKLEAPSKIIAPITRAGDSIIERKVDRFGKYAATSYKPVNISEQYTLCEVQLHTGRTHQIRVHFQYINHPLIGDGLYGGLHDFADGQALACCSLSFKHPITHAQIEVRDDAKRKELDNLFQQLCKKIEM
ncbi:RluA family pseudouridine synthase [Staphylococcus condimenti]|uniref:RNA pseudouridylate synthase n=1 Tax=Staphylococcus condimenti TaxID=70255 RepID=A0A143PB44_9STAP|nr:MULTISPECIES: RluA family pseudouridine synthase [Staphylococcus]AMY05308.1 RNA pseudouridine synthase [Staphylococcus condimenti]APR61515.1 RNA pseudouridine synthase [Staphylococcus condimenti]MDK8645317.1 RluA family pseudouridine synthase [Staphylococcus condimenti]OFO98770.1 RNA pseudouridine synthase [Staphylococcus sp. HMSC065E08]PNZ58375.1 RluA family pseudouridine synthase [Staphylococcus condimenti]